MSRTRDLQELQKPTSRIVLLGVGAPHGDDVAGWLVVEQLNSRVESPLIRKAATPLDLMDWVDEAEVLIICDACSGAGRPGSVHRWTWPDERVVRAHWSGSHDFPLPAALELADRLDRLPLRVAIWGIERSSAERGDCSSIVSAAARRLAEQLAQLWLVEAAQDA